MALHPSHYQYLFILSFQNRRNFFSVPMASQLVIFSEYLFPNRHTSSLELIISEHPCSRFSQDEDVRMKLSLGSRMILAISLISGMVLILSSVYYFEVSHSVVEQFVLLSDEITSLVDFLEDLIAYFVVLKSSQDAHPEAGMDGY